MDKYIYLISVFFVKGFVEATVVSECGTLSVTEPVVRNRPLNITLELSRGYYLGNTYITWGYKRVSSHETSYMNFYNSPNVSMYERDSIYYLHFSSYTLSGNATIFAKLISTYRQCQMEIQINISELADCGLLYQRTQRVVTGVDIELGYLPRMSVINNPGNHVRYWLFTPDICPVSNVCTRRNITGDYLETGIKGSTEYVLTISNINSTMTGVYQLQCTENRRNKTNGKHIQVLVPPSTPIFMDTRDFEGCKQCIYGTPSHPITIRCNATGGTQPLSVEILVDEQKKKTVFLGGLYTADLEQADRVHMWIVQCKVNNKALGKPLVVSTHMYLIHQPGNPQLSLNSSLIEGKPINVSCWSIGGRPTPNVTFYISGSPIISSQTTIGSVSGPTTTTAVLTTIQTSWNQEMIKCCLSHEMLKDDLCTSDQMINYTFPPSSVTLVPPRPSIEDYPYNLVNFTCVIRNANPPCPAVWYFRNTIVTSSWEKTANDSGGYTSTNVVSVNISKDGDGGTIECSAQCNSFDVKKNDEYTITLLYAPKIEINISPPTANVTNGTTIVLQCTVKSYPETHISWVKNKDNTTIRGSMCKLNTLCISLNDTTLEDSGLYTCSAHNDVFETKTEGIEILIIENQQTRVEDSINNHVPGTSQSLPLYAWPLIAATSVTFVFLVIGMVIKQVTRKSSNIELQMESLEPVHHDNSNLDGENVYLELPRAVPCRSGLYDASPFMKTSQQKADMGERKPDEDSVAAGAFAGSSAHEEPDYGNIGTAAEGYTMQPEHAQKSHGSSKELIYADLDIQPSGSSVVRQTESPTDYVSIDFTKKSV